MSATIATRTLNIDSFINAVRQRPAIWNRNYHCNKSFMEQTWDELSYQYKLPKPVLKAKWKGLRDNFRVEFKRIPRNELTGEMIINPEDHDSKWIYYKPLLFLVDHMRQRNPKPGKMNMNGLMDASDYPEMDSNDYDSDLPAVLRVQTEMLNPLSPHSSQEFSQILQQQHHKKDGLIEIPELDYSGPNHPSMNIDGIQVNMGALIEPKREHINGNGGTKRQRSNNDYFDDSSSYDNNSMSDPLATNTPNGRVKRIKSIVKDDDYHFLMSMQPFMAQLRGDQKLKVRMKMQKLIFKELYGFDNDEQSSILSRSEETTAATQPKISNDNSSSETEKSPQLETSHNTRKSSRTVKT